MRLCNWFAGIEIDTRALTATLGFSSDAGAPRVLGCKVVAVPPIDRQPPGYQRVVRDAVSSFAEWFHLESGGALSQVAIAVPGHVLQETPSSSEFQLLGPTLVDANLVERARVDALRRPRQLGPIVQSVLRAFVLDGQRNDALPPGSLASSVRLELDAWVARPDFVAPAVESLSRHELDLGPVVARAEATSELALTPAERRDGTVLISIGDEQTEVAVLVDSVVVDLFIVPLGRMPLFSALAKACNVSVDVLDRLDLGLMLDRMPSEPITQRVRSVLSGWGAALFTGVRRRLDDRNLRWRLQAGVVIVNSPHAFPTIDDCATRLLGTPARYATPSQLLRGVKGDRTNSFAALGLIPLQWKTQPVESSSGASREAQLVTASPVQSSQPLARGGLGHAFGRWLREFVPSDEG